MNEDDDVPEVLLYAGQVGSLPMEILVEDEDEVETPLNLTGLTVYLAGKKSFTATEVLLTTSQALHTDATNGITSLPIDLESVDPAWFAFGIRLSATIWASAVGSGVTPLGNLVLQIRPSAIPRIP